MSIATTIPAITAYTGTVPDKATQTKTEFANSVNPYLNYVDNTFIPDYEAAKTALNASFTEINEEIVIINAAALATAADVVLTHADVVLTHADVVLTHADVVATAALLDAFDDRYLGSKVSAPTLDNDGNALQSGALYYNTTSDTMFVYDLDLTTWIALTFTPTAHGSLTGLANDDHTQYHNDTRGDARYLKLSGGNLTGALNESRATVASHATTSDIWGALGNQIDFTGTATVTAFPNAPQAGATRELICAGACSFTAGANMLIDGVTTGNTVTCATNDKIIVRATSTTTFNLTRLKADGTAQAILSIDSLVKIATVTASTSATVDFDGLFSTTYDNYIIMASNVTVSDSNVSIRAYCKTSGTWDTGTNYFNATTLGTASSTALAYGYISPQIGNSSNQGADIEVKILNPLSTTQYKRYISSSITTNATPATVNSLVGVSHQVSTADTGIRLFASTGNILTGTFTLYGIAK